MQRLLSPTLLIAALASAPPAIATERVVYIRAGHLIDVVEGRVSSDQAILIRGERIESVGSRAELRAPDGADIHLLQDVAFVMNGGAIVRNDVAAR